MHLERRTATESSPPLPGRSGPPCLSVWFSTYNICRVVNSPHSFPPFSLSLSLSLYLSIAISQSLFADRECVCVCVDIFRPQSIGPIVSIEAYLCKLSVFMQWPMYWACVVTGNFLHQGHGEQATNKYYIRCKGF